MIARMPLGRRFHSPVIALGWCGVGAGGLALVLRRGPGKQAPCSSKHPSGRPLARYCGHVDSERTAVQDFDVVVITVSDRCARGERPDRSGPAAVAALAGAGIACGPPRVVPDGAESVSGAIIGALGDGARLVLTSGGTGISPRDLTPEGTRPLLRLGLPGIAERLRAVSADSVPASVLSRGLAGIADSTGNAGALVVNLPGSVGGARDGVGVVAPLVRHVLDQLDGRDH